MKPALLLPPLAALALALPAAAQQHDHAHAAAPASAAATTPAGATLENYRRWSADAPLQNWRAANDEAGRLGGHAGQLAPADDAAAHGSHGSGHAHHDHEARP